MKAMEIKNRENHLRSPQGTAFLSALISGILVHLFALVVVMHNHDDILPLGYGAGVTSGRWLLEIIGTIEIKLLGGVNVHYMYGVVFIAFLAAAAAFLVDTLEIKGRLYAGMIGVSMVAFPTVGATMLYRFTAAYYGLALLFAVAAPWVMKRLKYGFLAAIVLIAFSMGIYQAYVPVTIGIFVMMLIREAIAKKAGFWETLIRGIAYCVTLAAGLILYYVILKLCLHVTGTELSDYQGINTMGQLTVGELVKRIGDAYLCGYSLMDTNIYGIVPSGLLRWAYALLFAVTLLLTAAALMKKGTKFINVLIVCALLVLFVLAVNFVVVMSGMDHVHTLMVYAVVLVQCLPFVFADNLPAAEDMRELARKARDVLAKAAVAIVLVISLLQAYHNNANYMQVYTTTRQMENYLNALVAQVRMTEGFDAEKRWAFLGEIEDPMIVDIWDGLPKYTGNMPLDQMLRSYSRDEWLLRYGGYSLDLVQGAERYALRQTEEVREMPCWPSAGSIKVIGDCVVIKFSELQR